VRAWLGIQLSQDRKKLQVVSVLPGSPADKAGLRAGDRIVRNDNKPIESMSTFRWAIATSDIGKPVRLTIQRSGHEHTFDVILEEAPHRAGRRLTPRGKAQ
jgi:S1-C subfamily serine protease